MNCNSLFVRRAFASAITCVVISVFLTQDLSAQVTGEIRGRVSELGTDRPVSGARVEIDGSGLFARTAANGTYSFRGLEPREYKITVRALGYASRTADASVQNASVSNIDIALQPMTPVLERMLVEAAKDTAALNATTFSREEIEASGQRDLGDLLQSASGIVITRSGGPGQPARVSVRGSSSNQVLVLLDGVPLNSALSGSVDLSSVSLENIERVTVLTGAQSARYGPRAMAGVIEIVSRRTTHERSMVGRIGGLGEWGLGATLGTSMQKKSGLWSGSLGVDHSSVEGDFNYSVPQVRGGGRARRVNADVASTQVNANAVFDNQDQQFRLRGSFGETNRGMAGSIVQPSLSGRQRYTRLGGGANAEWKFGRWQATSSADVMQEASKYGDPTPPFGQPFADTVTALGISFTSALAARWQYLSVSTGIDLRNLALESNQLSSSAPTSQQLSGVWVNVAAERALTQGSSPLRLHSEFALRADNSSLLSDNTISPRMVLRIEKGLVSVSGSYGSGFAPPTIADQFFHEGVQVRANPELKPERTKHDIEGRLSISEVRLGPLAWNMEAAAFRSDVSGMILWFPNFQFVWSPNNYDVKRRGWEARSTMRVPSMHLEFQGSIDHTDVSYTGGVLSGQVVYRPRVSASLQSSLSIDAGRLDVITRYVGTRRTAPGSNLNALSPYQMIDIRLSTNFTPNGGRWTYSPVFTVENLFNRDAAMLVDYPFPTRMWSVALRVRRSE